MQAWQQHCLEAQSVQAALALQPWALLAVAAMMLAIAATRLGLLHVLHPLHLLPPAMVRGEEAVESPPHLRGWSLLSRLEAAVPPSHGSTPTPRVRWALPDACPRFSENGD